MKRSPTFAGLLCVLLAAAPHAFAQRRVDAPDADSTDSFNSRPASADAERRIAQGRNDVPTRLEAARAYLAEAADSPSKMVAAREHLATVLRTQPANVDALLLAARMEMLGGRWRAAAEQFRKVIAAAPRRTDAYLGLGDALTRLDDEKGAAQAFEGYRTAAGMKPIEQP